MTLSMGELGQRHQAMLELQEQIAPFTPSIRDVMTAWGLSSTSSTLYVLGLLVRDGLCKTMSVGKVTRYYAVTPGSCCND
jgi:hypothetical protein